MGCARECLIVEQFEGRLVHAAELLKPGYSSFETADCKNIVEPTPIYLFMHFHLLARGRYIPEPSCIRLLMILDSYIAYFLSLHPQAGSIFMDEGKG